MTGFARVRKLLPEGEVVLSIKSVNHRGLDLHFHFPTELESIEAAVRNTVKKHVARGHVQIHAVLSRSGGPESCTLNQPMLAAWLSAFEQAAEKFGLQGTPDLNSALRLPGMFQPAAPLQADSKIEETVLEAAREALVLLDESREQEGAAMAQEMKERSVAIRKLAERMEEIRSRALPAFHKRLNDRLRELLRGVGLEPQRLAQEAALLADRSDISEELIRLKTHAAQVEALLDSSGEMGKRLDFLLQEMNRETNTVLSKTGGIGELGLTITELALAAKSEIDKIREQSLNLE